MRQRSRLLVAFDRFFSFLFFQENDAFVGFARTQPRRSNCPEGIEGACLAIPSERVDLFETFGNHETRFYLKKRIVKYFRLAFPSKLVRSSSEGSKVRLIAIDFDERIAKKRGRGLRTNYQLERPSLFVLIQQRRTESTYY